MYAAGQTLIVKGNTRHEHVFPIGQKVVVERFTGVFPERYYNVYRPEAPKYKQIIREQDLKPL